MGRNRKNRGEEQHSANIDFGPGSDRRLDLYFQVNASINSLVFERSEPYPNSKQPLGASILAGR